MKKDQSALKVRTSKVGCHRSAGRCIPGIYSIQLCI